MIFLKRNSGYQIFEIQKFTGVLSFTGIGPSLDKEIEYEYDDVTLYKMEVVGSSIFDQLWVYHIDEVLIIVHFYSNNELVQKPAFLVV